MALTRYEETIHVEGFSVHFAMTDGKQRIVCSVSREALDDLAAKDGIKGYIADLFERYRSQIEYVASQKFELGDRHTQVPIVRITGLDLGV